MKKVLNGVRVLDFTDALAGPFCTKYLADCGCEVISIEKPGGKMNRSLPFFHKGYGIEYIFTHCGKKSIVIDLKNKKARGLVMELAQKCDVVVENYRPGVMKSLGLDYHDFREANPSIIMCSISGWGQTGTKSELMAADISVQAQSGILDLTGEPDQPPSLVGFPFSDFLAGLNAFGAICAALYNRLLTGHGDYIDIAMLDCAMTTLNQAVGLHLFSEGKKSIRRTGRFNSDLSPHGIFKGRDGYLAISARTDEGWKKLAGLMGQPELGNDARFVTQDKRVANNKEVTQTIETWLETFEQVSDAALLLQSYRILAAPVVTAGQAIDDPHFKIRDMLTEVEHSVLGRIKVLNSPLKFTNSRASVDEPPPEAAGKDTDCILKSLLQMNDSEIRDLKEAGVITGAEVLISHVVGLTSLTRRQHHSRYCPRKHQRKEHSARCPDF
ncbi:MAG TPA: CaiB/BaiF CoA-transferase family protein [Syntrophorhabdaceae bacterium]|nr:CaiB/BaiF CoA-transferase family protein [Syntrophorhabdaceae bacterium]